MKAAYGIALFVVAAGLGMAGWTAVQGSHRDALVQSRPPGPSKVFPVRKSDAEWRRILSPAAYDVLRHAGTEPPGSSPLAHSHQPGTYLCAGCGQPLFSSDAKFDSGTGWPSFFKPIRKDAVVEQADNSLGEQRTEVLCSRCGGHLRHVFDDGPPPTHLRYCMDGVALKFKKRG